MPLERYVLTDYVAVHEASHAVAAVLLGHRVQAMHMVPEPADQGDDSRQSGLTVMDIDMARPTQAAAIMAAGQVGSHLFDRFGLEMPGRDAAFLEAVAACAFDAAKDIAQRRDGAAGDTADIAGIFCRATGAQAFCGPRLAEFIYHTTQTAAELLANNWPAVVRVAKCVAKFQPVAGETVHRLITGRAGTTAKAAAGATLRRAAAVRPRHLSRACVATCSVAGTPLARR